MLNNKKGFTIVELIVVITILATLSTIGFISYSGYLIGVRDANRNGQLTSISEGLNILRTKGKLPLPEDKVNIYSGVSTNIIAYQGYVGKSVLAAINYSNDGLDPKEDIRFSYYLTANRKYFQLMGFLEDSENAIAGIINNTYAVDYSVKFPVVKGSKLGILVSDTNQPISELGIPNPGLNIANVNNLPLKSYLTNTEFVSGTGTSFAELSNVAKKGGKYYSVLGNTYVYDEPVY